MDAMLRDILQAVGVWDWLREQTMDMTEVEILAAVQNDFGEVVSGFEKRKAPSEGKV